MEAKPEPTGQQAITRTSATDIAALNTLSSEELAWRSRQGCRASFGQLVRRFTPMLLYFVSRKTQNIQDVEDLVQDTFVKAFENIHRYRKHSAFSTWLFTIAARLTASHYRKKQTSQKISRTGTHEQASPGTILLLREQRRNLWAQAMELSENQYQVLWLKYAEDMSIKDIAGVMGKSRVSVKVLLYRARTNLAERLQIEASEQNALNQVRPEKHVHPIKTEGASWSVDFSK